MRRETTRSLEAGALEAAASGVLLLPLIALTYYLALFLTVFFCRQLDTLQAIVCTNSLVMHPRTAIDFLTQTFAAS